MTPIRLQIVASSGSREGLLEALEHQARQFFGSAPFRLAGEVQAEAEVEVQTMQGPVEVTIWSGQATFVNVLGAA